MNESRVSKKGSNNNNLDKAGLSQISNKLKLSNSKDFYHGSGDPVSGIQNGITPIKI